MRVQADEITEVERLQLEIVKLVTKRRVEMDVLHHCVQGGKMARTFINRLNSRWTPLEWLVTKYNLEIGKPSFQGRLHPLSLQALKNNSVDNNNGEIWDIERLMSNSDWAVHMFVREGIEAKHRIKRAEEEQAALLLHIHRVCQWAVRQAEALLQILTRQPFDVLHIGCTRNWLELLLFSRLQTIQSMLHRRNPFSLDITHHEKLLAAKRSILTVLVTVSVDGVDGAGDEDGGEGVDEREGELEEEDVIDVEEIGDAVLCALGEEL